MFTSTKISCIFIFILLTINVYSQEQCISATMAEKYLNQHPENIGLIETLNNISINYIDIEIKSRSESIIPVVVHVLYNDDSDTQISTQQVQSQIDVLNEDFNALNSDISGVPSEFENLIGNIGIEFRLANVDPDGNETDGITRKYSTKIWGDNSTINDIKHAEMTGEDIWDPNIYLNIWVGNLKEGILGYGTAPETALMEDDGVIVGYQYFGNIGLDGPFNKGRTATHEIGHYLNLKHIWGPENNACSSDDCVTDTPLQFTYTTGCPTGVNFSCGSNDMFMNFMDYSDDACLLMFTEGQRLRMFATLENYRDQLINSSGYISGTRGNLPANTQFRIYPNPAKSYTNIEWDTNLYFNQIKLYNIYGVKVYEYDVTQVGKEQINISSLPNGIYVLSLSNELGSVTQKFSIFH